MILIADAGGTKTSWILASRHIETIGINPIRDSEADIRTVVATLPDTAVSEAHYYGAGCIEPFKLKVEKALRYKFPSAAIWVESDMLGAARALCGDTPGIACILGTGSNSCLYDGRCVVANVPPLGYILGDEGGGASLGRILVGDLLKGQLGEQLKEQFLATHRLTTADILQRVYSQPMPNRFLASLVPFIVSNRGVPGIRDMVVTEFRRFFRRNVAHYGGTHLPVHFVGGVAHSLRGELELAALLEGYSVASVLLSPIHALADYHRRHPSALP